MALSPASSRIGVACRCVRTSRRAEELLCTGRMVQRVGTGRIAQCGSVARKTTRRRLRFAIEEVTLEVSIV